MALVHGVKPIVTSGLVLCLDAGNRKSYPGTGTTWTDLSGRGINGTLNGGTGYSGTYGGSLVFDASNDYVNLSFVNPFAETVIVWARSNTVNWNNFGWLSASRSQNGHILHVEAGSKRISFYIGNSAGSVVGVTGLVDITAAADITIPHMYAYTTNGSNLHKGYIDGVEVGSSITSVTRTASPTTQNYYIGADFTFSRYGNGNIYSCLRYNRALTATEIAQNYNALKSRYI
jgi:hypothetical protein